MECIVGWSAARSIAIEPYGVDISPAIAARARERLPQWAGRIWIGDAAVWQPTQTFDTVHALLDTVETRGVARRNLVDHLLTFVRPGGRLVLSHYAPSITARELVEPIGYAIEAESGVGVWLRRE